MLPFQKTTFDATNAPPCTLDAHAAQLLACGSKGADNRNKGDVKCASTSWRSQAPSRLLWQVVGWTPWPKWVLVMGAGMTTMAVGMGVTGEISGTAAMGLAGMINRVAVTGEAAHETAGGRGIAAARSGSS